MILLTREYESSVETAKILRKKGYSIEICPIFKVVKRKVYNLSEHNDYNALIVTSKNALMAYGKVDCNKELICVGAATAEVAKIIGFDNVVRMNGGDAFSIMMYITEKFLPPAKFLYLRGNEITLDFKNELEKLGYYVHEEIVYHTIYRKKLPCRCKYLIFNDIIKCVLFYSSAAARRFVMLIKNENLEKSLSRTIACCISKKVASECIGIKWGGVVFSDKPTQESIFEKINSL